MISETLAAKELQRLINTPFFPSGARGQKQLVNALLTSRNEFIMASAVDQLLEEHDRQLTVAAIRAVVSAKNAADIEQSARFTQKCRTCSGSGFKIVVGKYRHGFQPDGSPHFVEATGARLCVCRGGSRG